MNRKRIQRLMRQMGIETIYPGKDKRTTLRSRQHPVYPYLLKDVEITHSNQVWCSDITYLPMEKGFGYLVAIMDWHSRKVLSWRVSNVMDSDFCVAALQEALNRYGAPEIFNTDQGSQFTSEAFADCLKQHQVKISMDGKGCWIDNVFIERLWRSVKYEEVYLHAYEDLDHCRRQLARYFKFYNTKRRHQSLEVQPDVCYYRDLPNLQQVA